MLNLKTLGTRVNEATVELRGRPVVVRGLSCTDRDHLDTMLGWPAEDGSRAALERIARAMALEYGIAVGWRTSDGLTWPDVRGTVRAGAWYSMLEEELAAAGIGRAEVELVLTTVAALEAGQAGEAGGAA